jgi:putative transposase
MRPYLPTPRQRGRPRVHGPRNILQAVFYYVLRTGCQWRMLPHRFPPWTTVYHYFREWRLDGTSRERSNRTIRKRLRAISGRNSDPSAGVVDSQSVSRLLVSEENSEAMTAARRSADGSATY